MDGTPDGGWQPHPGAAVPAPSVRPEILDLAPGDLRVDDVLAEGVQIVMVNFLGGDPDRISFDTDNPWSPFWFCIPQTHWVFFTKIDPFNPAIRVIRPAKEQS